MKRVLIGAAVLAVLSPAFAIWGIPVPQDKIVVEAAAEARFDEAWKDTMKVVELKKADQIRNIALSTEPKPVLTETIVPADSGPASAPPVIGSLQDKPVVQHRRRHARSEKQDVCQRHGMKKKMVGRYRWRCQKRL
jgi:hypothetical protein